LFFISAVHQALYRRACQETAVLFGGETLQSDTFDKPDKSCKK
jgi:hypothetical protein